MILSTLLLLAQDTDMPQAPAPSPAGAIFGLLVAVLCIAALWKIFSKAGQPGWAAIVPIYNYIVWLKIVGRPIWWIFLIFLCAPVLMVILGIDLAKSFGKGIGFALGLIFLPFIFLPILGFGSATYVGPAAGTSTPTAA